MARRAVPVDPSIGERIRTRRELRGWSVRHAADRAGIAPSTWSRIERSLLRTDRYMISDLAAALECTTADLTGQPHPPADRAADAAQARVPALWLALMEIAPDEPPTRAPRPLDELTTRMDLLDAHRTRSDYAAITQTLPDLLHDLHATSRGPDARQVLRWLVDATQTARGTLRALGRLAEATIAADQCRRIAEHLAEPVPLAVADWARANAAGGAGAYGRSLTLASRALDELSGHAGEDGALPVLGMLHLSCGLSSVRSSPAEAWAHLDQAAQIAERVGETRQWWMWFGPTNVGIWRMGALVDAGDGPRAVELAASVHADTLPSADRRATYHLERARGLTDYGGTRAAEAVRALLTAERIAPQRIRAYTGARATARFLLERSRRESALHGLCERLGVAGD